MKRRFFEVVFSILAMAALTGCVPFTKGAAFDVPSYELPPPRPFVDSFRAGVRKVDITPPAGFPTGGHGPAGSMARGAWTRLYARAFVLADERGNVAVFVSCDLFAIPGGLTAQVARNVGLEWKKKRGITIPAEAIILAATHTHQSPGNFLTAAAYNEAASKHPGFSPELFNFLSRQIEKAINLAMEEVLKTGPAELHLVKGKTDYLQLNRSPRTFMLNANALATMDALHPEKIPPPECKPEHETGDARSDFELWDCPRRRAADPTITVLQITRNNELVGGMVFYAGHPTVLDPPAPVYSGDFTGVAMSELERKLSSSSRLVVGFFNGAEGDIVVKRSVRDVREVVEVGTAFAGRVEPLLGAERRTYRLAPTITIHGAELDTTSEADRVCGKKILIRQKAHDGGSRSRGRGRRQDRVPRPRLPERSARHREKRAGRKARRVR